MDKKLEYAKRWFDKAKNDLLDADNNVGPTPTHSARYVAIPVESIPERFGSQLPKVDVETQENMKSKEGIEPTR